MLEGAADLLGNGCIENIQFEFGGTCIDTKIFIRDFFLLLEKDYELYRIVRNGIFPLGQYDESLEVFCYANYYAKFRNHQ